MEGCDRTGTIGSHDQDTTTYKDKKKKKKKWSLNFKGGKKKRGGHLG